MGKVGSLYRSRVVLQPLENLPRPGKERGSSKSEKAVCVNVSALSHLDSSELEYA